MVFKSDIDQILMEIFEMFWHELLFGLGFFVEFNVVIQLCQKVDFLLLIQGVTKLLGRNNNLWIWDEWGVIFWV